MALCPRYNALCLGCIDIHSHVYHILQHFCSTHIVKNSLPIFSSINHLVCIHIVPFLLEPQKYIFLRFSFSVNHWSNSYRKNWYITWFQIVQLIILIWSKMWISFKNLTKFAVQIRDSSRNGTICKSPHNLQ